MASLLDPDPPIDSGLLAPDPPDGAGVQSLLGRILANPIGSERFGEQSLTMPRGPFDPVVDPSVARWPGRPITQSEYDALQSGSLDLFGQLSQLVGVPAAAEAGGVRAMASRRPPGPAGFPPRPGADVAPGPHFELDPYELKPPDNLTPDQQNAVNHYSNLSTYMNEGEGPEVEALRGHLDAAIERSRLSGDARLYRGFSVPTEHIEQIKPGDVVRLGPGYVSTTASKDVARNFSNDETGGPASVFVEMRVPRGHPALHVPTSPEIENEFGIQHEVLLPRNTQFHVHSVNEKSDGRYEVLAEPVERP